MVDGFNLIAFASLTPMIFVMIYGMVLLSDIAKQVLAKDRPPERVNIYEIMSKPVISVLPDMDIRYCALLFEQFGISRAPVIGNKNLLGIVSYTDMTLRG